MKPWEELTERGKWRRLRPAAWDGLADYPITPVKLTFVGGFTNAIYRVDATDGVYALRIDVFGDHSDADVDVEVAWLDALSRDTDLDVSRPVRTRDGRPYTHVTGPGIPGERRATLFEWIPGRPLGDDLSLGRYRQLGSLSAALTAHGASFVPPHRPMAWDRIFYWPEEADPYVIDDERHAHHFAGDRREILHRAIDAIAPAFGRLPAGGAQVVHGDLHPWNVHVRRGRMWALDFEDVMWAHPVQDVAITLFYERSRDDYDELRAAFEEGYRTVAAWPESYPGEIDTFIAARGVSFVNFVLNVLDDPENYLSLAFPRLEAFLSAWGETP